MRQVAERRDVIPVLAELFRENGYEATSLALIGAATGLGKGSLYHFFPGGKDEMARAVLADIDRWFETLIFQPLEQRPDPQAAISAMFDDVSAYFRSGRRVCLVGVLALGTVRDRFAETVQGYFTRWCAALASALQRAGHECAHAILLAEEIVVGIQGAIVLARALDDPGVFARCIERLRVLVA
ncbi:MAG: TetR/AcrR family transcriptional regulator [Acetobacteraceae bacterium]|nr:TetR/AcrR family transcriptional regulator [Acetobacteraceae bacterium]